MAKKNRADAGGVEMHPEAGVSLPDAEEVRTDVPNGGSSRTIFKIIVGVSLITAIVVGAVIGTKKNKENIVVKPPRNSTITEVTDFLINNGVSSSDDLKNSKSYQYSAAKWLAEVDGANHKVPSVGVDDREGYDYMARYILTLTYYALDGPNWYADLGFLNWLPVCQWLGPSPSLANGGVICNSNGLPEALYLDFIGATGTLPTELGLLTDSLRILDFKVNAITGNIPDELCNLDDLRSIAFSHNKLTGSIPSCLAELDNLDRIKLDHNGFTGEIPAELATLDLTELVLDHNALSGDPTGLFNTLTDLKILHVQNNFFEGEIDGTFLVDHSQLTSLDMANNEFTCVEFPPHLFTLPKLITLDLSNNELNGELPVVTEVWSTLNFLSLDSNNFKGSIPTEIGRLDNLKLLDLSDNQFTGDIPEEIGAIVTLVYLDLSSNLFLEEVIPGSFVNLKSLEYLSLRHTNRNGMLPMFIDEMAQLRFLDLSHNLLTGEIPVSYGNLNQVSHILMNSNNIEGVIPEAIAKWPYLEGAFFGNTGLAGDFNFFCPNDDYTISVDCKEDTVACDCCECCAHGDDSCAEDLIDRLDQSERVQSIKKYELLYPDDEAVPSM